jgi:hypothetical protein
MIINELANRLFTLLRQMDSEASGRVESDKACGLCDYGWYARPELKKPQNEVEWSKRLAELLALDGIPANVEVEYPGQNHLSRRKRKRLDLRLQLGGSQSIAIEVKGAWSDYWGRKNRTYHSYLLHPLIAGLDRRKKHTVPFDLLKLAALRRPETDYIGLLLIGFEKFDDPMQADIQLLKELAGLSAWYESGDVWESYTVPAQRVRCWFWYREADGNWSMPERP